MTIFRRRRSRAERLVRGMKQARKRLPSTPSIPSVDLSSLHRPELPEMPSMPELPSRPHLNVRKRMSRDNSADTPMLSLAGGLLLGIFVGIVVAVILISRNDGDESSSARHTRITLLPHREGEAEASEGKSAAGTG
jgi:hypothetical protein